MKWCLFHRMPIHTLVIQKYTGLSDLLEFLINFLNVFLHRMHREKDARCSPLNLNMITSCCEYLMTVKFNLHYLSFLNILKNSFLVP